MDNKPRRPWLAALLTILEIGLGHIYAGNFKRGLSLFFIGQLLSLAFIASLLVITPGAISMVIRILVIIAFTIYCILDAVLIARRKKEDYKPAKYNRWFVYVGYLLITVLFVQTYITYIVVPYWIQPFKMPTGSMEPTLLVGDHALINKHIYRSAEPHRGEIIVFGYPPDPSVPYIKRLIGVPGDTIEMVGRTVYINGKAIKEKYTQYTNPNSDTDHFGPYRVPPDQYFVLGDNRDNSQDSRFYGFVPMRNLLGKPLMIYWSYETSRDEYLRASPSDQISQAADKVMHFFSKTRWNRTFKAIE